MTEDSLCQELQCVAARYLLRHQSILDILSKLQETGSRINRATVKTVTNCGCLKINASKKILPEDATLEDFINIMDSDIEGELCTDCREIIEQEIGQNLFYLAALCNTLDIDLDVVMKKELLTAETLRFFQFK